MKKNLDVTTEKSWKLSIQTFESGTKGSDTTYGKLIDPGITQEEIQKIVLDFENKQRCKHFAWKNRDVVYCYWVIEEETLTVKLEELEHENQSSTKETQVITPNTYVRGEIITIGEALAKPLNDKFSEYEKATLSNFISIDLKMGRGDFNKEQLDTKIMMIQGAGKRQTFFDHVFDTTQVKVFPQEKLVQIEVFEKG